MAKKCTTRREQLDREVRELLKAIHLKGSANQRRVRLAMLNACLIGQFAERQWALDNLSGDTATTDLINSMTVNEVLSRPLKS